MAQVVGAQEDQARAAGGRRGRRGVGGGACLRGRVQEREHRAAEVLRCAAARGRMSGQH